MSFKVLILFIIFLAKECTIATEYLSCSYIVKKVYINNEEDYKYSCHMSVNKAEIYESENEIIGEHETSNADGDVEVLQLISNSNIDALSAVFCNKFENLVVLNLENVKIKSIDDDAFQNCAKLKVLHLNSTGISYIPENLLSENTELIEIKITFNNIQSLTQDMFELQENLVKLHLNNNKIKFMHQKVFVPLKNLEFLNLNSNQIENLNPELFKDLKNLKKLSLNSNKISDLPSGLFDNLSKLQMLELNSNKLSVISSRSFGIHGNLIYVDLADNNIFAIDRAFFIIGPINTLIMEGNECLDGTISYRDDENLQNCYDNFNEVTLTSSSSLGTSTMPTTTTTVTKPLIFKPKTTTTTKTTTVIPFKPAKIEIQFKTYSSGEYPWIAAIMLTTSKYQCGGILVTDMKILTAASCLYSKIKNTQLLPRDIQIVLGSRKISLQYETGKQVFAAHRLGIHPDFDINSPLSSGNIGVIFVENIKSNRHIKPIQLNPNILSITDAVYVAHGNNKSLSQKSSATTAGYLQTSILSNENCPSSDSKETFCISNDSETPSCVDVIGSGLFVKQNDKFYLRGILTYVSGSCEVDSYSLFTDITRYISWIENVVPEDFEERELSERK